MKGVPLKFLKKPYWSPYIAGIIIGLLQIPIFLLLHASIGSSVSFHGMACSLLSWFKHLDMQQTTNSCFPMLKHWWQLGFIFGIIGGAYLSSTLSGIRRKSFSPIWQQTTGTTTLLQRSILAFCGGFIMLFGARLADGCTSGNGISGISLLSIGSMIVILSMFIAGVIVAYCYKKL